MVIKGGSRSGAAGLAAHLLRADTNERVDVLELHGVNTDRLPDALHEMELVASGTRCRKPLYHASINTGRDELLTIEQKAAAVARLELELGLEGHARAVVEHRKEGRDHLHVVWSRIDVDTMRAVHDGHNYRRHEQVARELEREFGHHRVQGAHIERDGAEGERRPRPPRTPAPNDVQQAVRTRRGLPDVSAELTRLWQQTDGGPAFAAALARAGYVLARGDKRGFCVVDIAGGVHSLARRIEGAKARDVSAGMADVELAALPSVDAARRQQWERQVGQEHARDPRAPATARGEAAAAPARMARHSRPERQDWASGRGRVTPPQPEQRRSAALAAWPTSPPTWRARPAMPAPVRLASAPRLFMLDDLPAELRAAGQARGPRPAPPPARERDRDDGCRRCEAMRRPAVRLAAVFGMDTGWIVRAKGRLIDWSARTGAAIADELRELDRLLHVALYGPP